MINKLLLIKFLLTILIFTSFLERVQIEVGDGWLLKPCQIIVFVIWIYIMLAKKCDIEIRVDKRILMLLLFLIGVAITTVFATYFQRAFKATVLLGICIFTTIGIQQLTQNRIELIEHTIEKLILYGFYSCIVVIISFLLYSFFTIDVLGAELNYLQSYSDGIGEGTVTRAYGFYGMAPSAGVTMISVGILLLAQIALGVKKLTIGNTLKLLVFFLGANATYTRGYFLGLMVAVIFLVVFVGYLKGNFFKTVRYFLKYVLVILGILLFLFIATPSKDFLGSFFSKFGAMFDFNSGSGFYRILVWSRLIEDFFEHPFLGNGMLYYQMTFFKGGNAENFLLEILSGAGLLGFLGFIIFNFLTIKKAIKVVMSKVGLTDRKKKIVIQLLLSYVSMFIGYLTNPGFWTIMPWLILGLLLAAFNYTLKPVENKIIAQV